MATFEFGLEPERSERRRVASIGQVAGRRELMASLDKDLSFPGWWGWNWDALDDLFRDLSWIAEDEVVIYHRLLPRLPFGELRTYLAVLHEIGQQGLPERHHVRVVFAPELEQAVAAVVA